MMCVHSVMSNYFVTPWTVARQAPLSMEFSRKNTGVGCYFLLQGIFPTQELNTCLLHLLYSRQILYHRNTWEAFILWLNYYYVVLTVFLCYCFFLLLWLNLVFWTQKRPGKLKFSFLFPFFSFKQTRGRGHGAGSRCGDLSPGRPHSVTLSFKIISSKSEKRSSSLEYQVLFSLIHRLIL